MKFLRRMVLVLSLIWAGILFTGWYSVTQEAHMNLVLFVVWAIPTGLLLFLFDGFNRR